MYKMITITIGSYYSVHLYSFVIIKKICMMTPKQLHAKGRNSLKTYVFRTAIFHANAQCPIVVFLTYVFFSKTCCLKIICKKLNFIRNVALVANY